MGLTWFQIREEKRRVREEKLRQKEEKRLARKQKQLMRQQLSHGEEDEGAHTQQVRLVRAGLVHHHSHLTGHTQGHCQSWVRWDGSRRK